MANKLVSGVNDLATLYPKIAAEWNDGKNKGLSPDQILPGSGKRVWWCCRNGHEWNTAVYHRTEGHGCKICASRKAALKPGVNDLASRSPALVSEWDREKNALTPDEVTAYSQVKIWWKCSDGHSWKTTVNHRFKGQGCPYCAGNRILPGFNDIVTMKKDFLAEWDYEKNDGIKPEMVGPGTQRRCWWKCRNGHGWQAPVYSRSAGNGCPYCAGNILVPGVNDLMSSSPEIAKEWDYEKNGSLRPEMVSRTSAKSYWWICPKGHSYRSSASSRSRGCGCSYCVGKKVLEGFNDFQSQHPDLMPQWDWEKNAGVLPTAIASNHHRKVWWRDACGHSWKATTSNRIRGNGCPFCAGRQVLKGFNDLASRYPSLAGEWDVQRNNGVKPDEVTYGSDKNVWWMCSLGHSWRATVSARAGRATGCPYCSNRKVLPGFNDFASYHPKIVNEWDWDRNGGKAPTDYTYGSCNTVWWICPENHEYKLSLANRHAGRGCPYCAGSKVLAGYNDLKTRAPWLAEEWDYERNHGKTPEQVFPCSNRKAWWVCKRGHYWRASINARQNGAGCPFCYGLLPGRAHFVS